MIRILDWYILKRYLVTLLLFILLFIPIAILANLAEKIDNIFENNLSFWEVFIFYKDFSIHFLYILFPFLLFIAVIFFTSKLANDTEIIAILSSGVSFNRFLRPYIIGATTISLIALLAGMFTVPKASKNYREFDEVKLRGRKEQQNTYNLYRQLNDNDYIYAHAFYPSKNKASKFTLEHFENDKLIYKISADELIYKEKDTTHSLKKFVMRKIGEKDDIIIKKNKLDTLLNIDIDRLTPVEYVAETLDYFELKKFMKEEKRRGSPNMNRYRMIAYKRWSIPIAAYILTIIAVAVSSMKRRGGMGVNLALGFTVAFGFVFIDRVFSTLAIQSDFSPLLAVWLPNIFFAGLALYLLARARR